MRFVFISDTHEQHRKVSVPDGDVLIHAGDYTYFNRSAHAVKDFNEWLAGLPHKHKIVIPGNHESKICGAEWRERITAANVLANDGIQIDGLHVWGSPATPDDWRTEAGRRSLSLLYGLIPEKTDILVTHCPPFGILDSDPATGEPQGSPELLSAVRRTQPRLHVFGHIHGSYGHLVADGTQFVNAALAGKEYTVTKPAILISLTLTKT